MRRFTSLFVVFSMVFLFSIPAFAYQWPPPSADIPRTVITKDTASLALSGVKTSMRSITNIGIKIMGIVTVFSLIGVLFKRIVIGGITSKSSSVGDSGGAYRETKL